MEQNRTHRSPGTDSNELQVEIPLPKYADTWLDNPPPSHASVVAVLPGNKIEKASIISRDPMPPQLPGPTSTHSSWSHECAIVLPSVETTHATRPDPARSRSSFTAEHNRCTCIFLTSAGTLISYFLFLALTLHFKVF